MLEKPAAGATRRPPFPEPPHAVDPTGAVLVWFTQPAGFVVQLSRPTHGSAAIARFIAERGTDRLLELASPGERLYFVHDFSALTSYDSEARTILTAKAATIRNRVERVVVVPPPVANKLARMGLSAAAAALSLAGVPILLEDSLIYAVGRFGLRARRDIGSV